MAAAAEEDDPLYYSMEEEEEEGLLGTTSTWHEHDILRHILRLSTSRCRYFGGR
jgi:hypothetical protein